MFQALEKMSFSPAFACLGMINNCCNRSNFVGKPEQCANPMRGQQVYM